ncbi:MAG: DUF4097 family beta strand repeat protein [Agathobacter sp.]|nr:DUF4097 family beta strand repeat protein [Agathobacter sp.]
MGELMHVATEIKELDINLNYGELYFEKGESFAIFVESNSENDFSIEENGNCLSIWDERKKKHISFSNKKNEHSMIKIMIPENMYFEKIRLTTGAVEFHADTIQTGRLIIKMGAGEFHINHLCVSDFAQIDGGAGEIEVENGTIHNLTMSFGAGEVNMHAAITGDSQISAGVGELNLKLIGYPEDYSATISKGIGHCHISGFTNFNGNTYGNGANKLKISGGVGEISVSFEN